MPDDASHIRSVPSAPLPSDGVPTEFLRASVQKLAYQYDYKNTSMNRSSRVAIFKRGRDQINVIMFCSSFIIMSSIHMWRPVDVEGCDAILWFRFHNIS